MTPYVTLKSLVDKDFLGPAGLEKGARGVGDPCRMPCMVRKEVMLEPHGGARIRKKKKYHPP